VALLVIAVLALFRPNPLFPQTKPKTFLSPLHRALITRGVQLAESAKDLWGREDRERAESALSTVRAFLEGSVLRESVLVAEKRTRAAAGKYSKRAGKRPWAEQEAAILLVSAVARLAASEYPKTQVQLFEQCLTLARIK
jgi:hypothetical protein